MPQPPGCDRITCPSRSLIGLRSGRRMPGLRCFTRTSAPLLPPASPRKERSGFHGVATRRWSRSSRPEDVARAAAGLLTSSEVAAGATYPLIGAVYTLKDIIETFGRVLGKDVRYQEVSDDEWRSE